MEALLLRKRRGSAAMIDIDFARQTTGDTSIVDNAGNIWTGSTTASNRPVVVSDPVMGKVMQFSGAGYFDATRPAGLTLSDHSFVLDAIFKPNTSAQATIFGTGDWTSTRTYGVNFSINQYPSTYIQLFMDNGSYARMMVNITNSSVWEHVVITRTKGKSIKMELYRNGVLVGSNTIADFAPGNGNAMMRIGNSHEGGNFFFNGLLKSLKLSLLS